MKQKKWFSILPATFFIVFNYHYLISQNEKKELTGCDHPSGWCNEIRETAKHSWKYAQLAQNAYCRPNSFNVSYYYEKIRDYIHNDISFFATLYRDKKTNEMVLVFRGTDSFKDFATGNNPFKQQQNSYALTIYDEIKTKYLPKKFIVVGHSLGGGIAIHVSLNRENVIAYSFNGSPVFKNRKGFENKRYSIVERGEILKLPRMFRKDAEQEYTSINCTHGDPITQHSMESLANCLTQIAGIEDVEARKSLKLNKMNFDYAYLFEPTNQKPRGKS